jgi:predicted GNAT family acetyltransferase
VRTISYDNAADFLKNTQGDLEINEVANSLILGICRRLVEHPERIETPPLFKTVHDERGLALAAIMTPPFNLVLSGHRRKIGAAVRRLVEELVAEETTLPGVLAPSEEAETFARAWSDATGQSATISMRQRAFELREVKVSRTTTGDLRPASADDLELVTQWCYGFMMDAFGEGDIDRAREIVELRIEDGAIYLWVEERPVSMAMKTRPTRQGISISFVYTPPELRKRGFATACVAELSRLLLESGREFCTLITDLSNPTSNHIYQEIGYRPVKNFDQYSFES